MTRDTLVHALARSAEAYPDRAALILGPRAVSYARLYHMAAALAEHLAARGLAVGDRVALLSRNSPEYAAAYYGIQAAGGVAVALNVEAKARDLGNWLRHCEARWLIADARHPELPQLLAQPHDWRIILIGEVPPGLDVEPHESFGDIVDAAHEPRLAARAAGDELAAIIYTSGTTGEPKGVTLSHRNLYANIQSILSYLRLADDEIIVNVLPFYYSYGNSILHTHVAVGGTIVLENSLLYPQRVLQSLARHRATGFSGVPSTFTLLLGRARVEAHDLSALRYVTQAGGPLAPSYIRRWRELVPHARFFVMYGQTEASARLTWLPPERLDEKMGSVGIPIPGVEIELRDEHGRVVPEGETGEIWARGENIMQGYWRNPERTAETIVDGWLRTGDLARRDADGFLYIVGRNADMIKSGAHRIHPKDIEEAISELDGVVEVAVVGVPDELLGQVVKAVIVAAPDSGLDERRVKAHCRERLAQYKVPRTVEFVEELPKTASGKIRRFMLA